MNRPAAGHAPADDPCSPLPLLEQVARAIAPHAFPEVPCDRIGRISDRRAAHEAAERILRIPVWPEGASQPDVEAAASALQQHPVYGNLFSGSPEALVDLARFVLAAGAPKE